jgi:REP element-mobilizing transposase RayT
MNIYNPDIHHRQSVRLRAYDYSQDGAYFVTICTLNRLCIFGGIDSGTMILNENGIIAQQCLQEIPTHYPNAICQHFVVMPNHVHGIIELNIRTAPVGALHATPLPPNRMSQISPAAGSIPTIVRSYKSAVTQRIHQTGYLGMIWQRNYYEHIIRDDENYKRIVEYIETNPVKWEDDELWNE